MLAVLPIPHSFGFKGLHCHNSFVKTVTESIPVARLLLTEQEVCNILETQWYQAFQTFICTTSCRTYPFMEPTVNPCTKYFWKNVKTNSMGPAANITVAILADSFGI